MHLNTFFRSGPQVSPDSQKGAKGTKTFYIFHSVQYDTTVTMYNVHQQTHTLCYNYSNILTYTNSCIFQASLAHHQGMHSSIKQSLDLSVTSSMWNCINFFGVWFIETDMCTVIGAVQ
jgi:hypothetical protein